VLQRMRKTDGSRNQNRERACLLQTLLQQGLQARPVLQMRNIHAIPSRLRRARVFSVQAREPVLRPMRKASRKGEPNHLWQGSLRLLRTVLH